MKRRKSKESEGVRNHGFEHPEFDSVWNDEEKKHRRTSNANDENNHTAIKMNGFVKDDEKDPENVVEEEDEDFGFFSMLDKNSKLSKTIYKLKEKIDIPKLVDLILPFAILTLYIAYLLAVIIIQSAIQDDSYWCSGDGFLFILTGLVGTCLLYFKVIKKYFSSAICKALQPLGNLISKLWNFRIVKWSILLGLVGLVVAFYIIDTVNQRRRLISLIGLTFILTFGFLFSKAPKKIVWRYTIWGMSLQFLLGLMVLRWPLGNSVLGCLSEKVTQFLSYSTEGAVFVFGELAQSPSTIFAFTVLPVTIFFSFCTNILYYFGAVQWLVIKLGWLFQVTVGTGLCESMNAAGSIFLGMTESPLLVKPYLSLMTKSELHSIMTAGFATIAGSVLAAFVTLGADASLLLTASVMNAPAALAISKLFYPNTRPTRINAQTVGEIKSTEVNALHAGCVGVTNALPLVANIAGNLIAFIAFVAFFNSIFDWSCQLVNIEEGTCSLEGVFGYVFMPLAWMMGVQWDDCYYVGQLIGLKVVINEFVAYTKLSEFISDGVLSDRSEAIATFALCGFGNISSIGIMMGGLGPLAPERKVDMAKIAFRAMVAGCLATFSSACIAGTLLPYSIDDGLHNATTTMMSTTMMSTTYTTMSSV